MRNQSLGQHLNEIQRHRRRWMTKTNNAGQNQSSFSAATPIEMDPRNRSNLPGSPPFASTASRSIYNQNSGNSMRQRSSTPAKRRPESMDDPDRYSSKRPCPSEASANMNGQVGVNPYGSSPFVSPVTLPLDPCPYCAAQGVATDINTQERIQEEPALVNKIREAILARYPNTTQETRNGVIKAMKHNKSSQLRWCCVCSGSQPSTDTWTRATDKPAPYFGSPQWKPEGAAGAPASDEQGTPNL